MNIPTSQQVAELQTEVWEARQKLLMNQPISSPYYQSYSEVFQPSKETMHINQKYTRAKQVMFVLLLLLIPTCVYAITIPGHRSPAAIVGFGMLMFALLIAMSTLADRISR